MDVEKVQSVNVWPYVGFYSLMTISLTVAFMGILFMFPTLTDSFGHASSFVTPFGSTSFASYKFVRRNGRLFNRNEYWKITLFSSLAAYLVSLLLVGLAVAGRAIPGSGAISPVGWVFILLFGGLLIFAFNAAGYSSRMGKSFLKVELARQARINAETFQ